MGFDSNKFIKQEFESRTEEIGVPALSDWFGKDDKPIWVVRNLTGNEMAVSQEASIKNKNLAAIAEALTQPGQVEKVKALRSIIGNSDDVCAELAKRLEMIVFGSVEPTIGMDIAIKFAENFPVEFMQITNKITILTGLGASKAKRTPSGKMSQSETV